MKLYKIIIHYKQWQRSFTFFVVAENIADAEKLSCDTFKKYDYGDFLIHSTELIAQEGQYSEPDVLIVKE